MTFLECMGWDLLFDWLIFQRFSLVVFFHIRLVILLAFVAKTNAYLKISNALFFKAFSETVNYYVCHMSGQQSAASRLRCDNTKRTHYLMLSIILKYARTLHGVARNQFFFFLVILSITYHVLLHHFSQLIYHFISMSNKVLSQESILPILFEYVECL